MERNAIENDLKDAVMNLSQFTLYHQPQVTSEGKIVGTEALLRWNHPRRGLVMPGDFIPMGEASTSNMTNAIEVTFSTRSLLRWGDLTVRFQPLAHQGVQPVTYALDRALAFRASRETRAMLHELAQRMYCVVL